MASMAIKLARERGPMPLDEYYSEHDDDNFDVNE